MTRDTLTADSWSAAVERLGGRELLEQEGRKTGVFKRARAIGCAVDALRQVLAYCLDALLPPPTLAQIKSADPRLTRNLREPKRKRDDQPTALIS